MAYSLKEEERKRKGKLNSGSITKILPRMRNMKGPYDMYGTVYGFNTAVVHIAHPVPMKAILTAQPGAKLLDSTAVSKSPAYDHFENFCGRGVFTANGEDWKLKRISVVHALFRGDWERKLHRNLSRVTNELIRVIVATEQTAAFDIVPLLQKSTVDLIYQYLTHSELGSKKRSSSVSESFTLLDAYLGSIASIRQLLLAQSRSFWVVFPRWVYRAFSSLFRAEEECMRPIRKFALSACDAAKPGSPLYILSHNAKYAESQNNLEVMHEAVTLLFAGQDTTAATLSWALHLLSLHPCKQDKLASRVNLAHELGQSLESIAYLSAVIKEAMRLFPVAPFIVRRLQESICVPYQESSSTPQILLPSGSLACIWIYGLHRNDRFWDLPDDFLPERWLDGSATQAPFIPYAIGPRNCLGQPIARIILREVLAALVRAFEFVPGDDNWSKKDMQVGFTVLPKDGVKVKALKRVK